MCAKEGEDEPGAKQELADCLDDNGEITTIELTKRLRGDYFIMTVFIYIYRRVSTADDIFFM